MKILVTYHIMIHEQIMDKRWRRNLLGREHWCGRSYNTRVISITVAVTPEQASFIALSRPLQITPLWYLAIHADRWNNINNPVDKKVASL